MNITNEILNPERLSKLGACARYEFFQEIADRV